METERRWRSRLAAVLLVAVALWGGATAHAQDGTDARRVVVLAGHELSALGLARLRGELNAAGFEVVEIVPEAPPPREVIVQVTEAHAAIATLTLVERAGAVTVDLWVRDEHTGLTRRMTRVEADDAAERTLSLRAVELLESSLVELERSRERDAVTRRLTSLATTAGQGAVQASWAAIEARRRAAAVREDALGLALATGIAMWVGDGHVAAGPVCSASWSLDVGLGWRVRLVGPAWGTRVETARGTATIRQLSAGLDVGWWLSLVGDVVQLRPAVGVGVWQVAVDGVGVESGTGRSVTRWGAVFEAGLGLRWDVARGFGLGLELEVVRAVQSVAIEIAGERPAALGGPSGRGGLVGVWRF